MNKKRWLALFLALVMCFALVACAAPAPDSTETTAPEETVRQTEETVPTTEEESPVALATPLLYRVTDGEGHVVWLFGSIHVGREDYYPLPDYVLDAFDGADSLAVEVDILTFEKNLKLQIQAMSCLLYTDGTSIQDHISPELYTRSVEVLKELGIYMASLDSYCPSLWSSTIDSAMMEKLGGDINLGIDRYLLKRARSSKKEILEVESAMFQYEMLAGFSDELQELLLAGSLDTYENSEAAREDMQSMMDLWAAGDEQAFAAFLSSADGEIAPEEESLYLEYNQAMLTDRNLSMTDYAEAALLSGKEVFICVGAAHVVGEGGMAQLLAERGYTVECITQ